MIRGPLLAGLMLVVFLGSISLVEASSTTPIGYELLANNSVVHIWNTQDSYYFDVDSGLQFTNHFEQYWTKNVFCGGAKIGGTWQYYCTDELPFTWSIDTDNLTYVNITGFRVVNQGPYSIRVGIRYHLKTDDLNLTVEGQLKNLGPNIPVDLGFAWHIRNIQIATIQEDNNITLGWSRGFPLHNESTDELLTGLPEGSVIITYAGENESGIGEWLGLWWNNNLTYAVQVQSVAGQYNSPVTLAINAGPLNAGQTKGTTFRWKDATCGGVWSTTYSNVTANSGSFTNSSPKNFPPSNLDTAGDYLRFSDSYGSIPEMRCYQNGANCPAPSIEGFCSQVNGRGFVSCRIHSRTSLMLADESQQATNNWQNGQFVLEDTSLDGQNCDKDGGGNYAVLQDYQLPHDNFTDFRCRVIIYSWFYDPGPPEIETCSAQNQGVSRLDNWWLNNNTPYADNVTVLPEDYTIYDNLTCTYDYFDADGDSENTTFLEYTWLNNSVEMVGFNVSVLISGNISEGDNWTCGVKVYDDVMTRGTNEEEFRYSDDYEIFIKAFLLEIYITFEAIGVILLVRGINKGIIVNVLLAMGLFFALAVLAGQVEPLTSFTQVYAFEALAINFGLGLIAFVFAIIGLIKELKPTDGL